MIQVALVLLFVLVACQGIPRDQFRPVRLWPILVIAVGLAVRFSPNSLPFQGEWVIAVGAVLLFATALGGASPAKAASASAALGAATAAAFGHMEAPAPTNAMGFWWLIGISATSSLAARAVLGSKVRPEINFIPFVAAAASAPMALAHVSNSFPFVTQWIWALYALGAMLLAAILAGAIPKVLSTGVMIAAAVLAGFFLKSNPDLDTDMFLAVLAALGAAGVSVWLAGDAHGRVAAGLATALIWFPVATLGFAAARGFGITVVTAIGLITLIAFGGARLVFGLAPLIALGLFRVLQATQPETTRAFDLGQHYALLGFLVGIVAVLALIEWEWPSEGSRRTIGAMALWISLAFGLPAASVYLGQKGSVGLFVGVIAAAVLAPAIRRSATAAGAIGILAASYIAAFMPRWLDWMELTRAERIPKLTMLLAGAAIAAVVAIVATKPSGKIAEATS